MKKKSIVYSVLLLIGVAGTVLIILGYEFVAGLLIGLSGTLTVVYWLGQKQLEATAKRMDKIMKDHQIQLENDKL